MKTIEVRVWVREVPSDREWVEKLPIKVGSCERSAVKAAIKTTLREFNVEEKVRYGEDAPQRKLVAFRWKEVQDTDHDWEKASLVTEAGGYDRYRCVRCGAKGKRYGVEETVRPDRKNQLECMGK